MGPPTHLVLLMLLSSQKRLLPQSLLILNKPSRPRRPPMLLPETLLTLMLPTLSRPKLELPPTPKKLVIKTTTHTQLFQDTTRTFSSQKRKFTFLSRPHKTPTRRKLTHSLLSKPPSRNNCTTWMNGKLNTPLP